MNASCVVVDIDQIESGVLAAVGAACARARAELVPWRHASPGPAQSPALVIGALRRGERRIPAELVDAVTQLAPDAGLLLMSDEPLVRPVVSTHGGRVTLLAQPASPARVRGTVRMLLAERGDYRRERLEPHVWTATVQPVGGEPPPPALRQDDDGTLTAVFPLTHGWSGADPLCDEAHALMLGRFNESERYRRVNELLGPAAALLHLTAGAQQWAAYWPASACPLLLCSPVRLPRLCDLAGAAAGQILHLTASSGDVMIALSHALPLAQGSAAGINVWDGGAAFLDQLETHAPDGAVPSGLVVEIR